MAHDPGMLLGGSDCNLSLELGAVGTDDHFAEALSVLWTCPSVDGPRAVAGDIGVSGQLGTARDWQNDANWRFGTLRMDGVTPPLPFIVYCIRERKASAKQMSEKIKFGIQTKNPSDWLTLGIPIGVLCSAWSVDYSWVTANQPWLSDLCARLAGIADHLHRRAPIASGVMGEEASGCYRRPTFARAFEAHQDYPPLAVLTAEIVEARGGFVIPSRLWALLAPRATSITMSSGLHYVPPNPNAPLTGT